MPNHERKPTAVVGRRVGAFLIDFLVTGAVYWALFFLFAERRATAPSEAVQANLTLGDSTWAITGGRAALFFLLFIVVGFAYWSVLPGITGWTVGKLATGIRVVGADGSLPGGVGRNLLRQVVGIVDYFPYFLPGLTGFVVALADGRNRRVGDMAAKTYVVRKDAAGRPVEAAAPPSGGQAAATQDTAAVGAPGPAATSDLGPPAAASGQGLPAAASGPGPPAGWYQDPSGQARLRYWDGGSWTEHTAA